MISLAHDNQEDESEQRNQLLEIIYSNEWFMDVFGYAMTPFHSSEDGIRTWNSTSIGIRLQANKDIVIAAPYGLTDLLQMKFRRNTAHIPRELFLAQAKNIKEKWPMVEVIED